MLSDRADAALVALIIPAMEQGGKLEVLGVVSPSLHYSVSRYASEVVLRMIPHLSPLQVQADLLEVAEDTSAEAVITGFSGGIDSFSLLAGHYLADRPSSLTLTHLLFNNVGSHGSGKEGGDLAKQRLSRLLPAVEEIGLPIIPVDSNLHEFYQTVDFQSSHTLRNAAVPLVLQRGVRSFLYASAYDYRHTFIGRTNDSAYGDPILLPLLSTERTRLLSADCQLTRVQKTLRVAQVDLSYKHLDVCVRDGLENCSECWKCMRTMTTLHIAGLLDRYSGIFDLSRFMRSFPSYIAEVVLSRDPLLQEIREFADMRQYPLRRGPVGRLGAAMRLAGDRLYRRL